VDPEVDPDRPGAALSAEAEDSWTVLRRHLQWGSSGTIGFVLTADPRVASTLRERAEFEVQARVERLLVLRPSSPIQLASLDTSVRAHASEAECLWVEAVAGTPDDEWGQAWSRFLEALNHRRDTLRGELAGTLLLVGPPWILSTARTVAADLWSIRSVVITGRASTSAHDERDRRTLDDGGADDAPASTLPLDFALDPATIGDESARAIAEAIARGRAAKERGDAAAMGEAFGEATSIARSTGDVATLAAVLGSIAHATLADDPGASLTALREALRLDGLPDRDELVLCDMTWACLRAIGAWSQMLAPARRATVAARGLADQLRTPAAERDLSVTLTRLGDTERANGAWEAARQAYAEGLTIDRRLARQIDSAEAQRDLSVSLNKLGDAEVAAGDWDAARQAYTEALAIARRLADQLKTPEAERDLSVSLNRLGDAEAANGNWSAARQAHVEALAIRQSLADQLETPGALRDLSVGLNKLGDIERATGDWDAARAAHTRALGIARRLTDQASTPEAHRDLSISLTRLGDTEVSTGDWDAARRAYAEALEIDRRLALQLDTPEAHRDLSISLDRLGDVGHTSDDWGAAGQAYAESLAIRRRLVDQLHTPEAHRDLSVGLIKCALVAEQEGDTATARALLTEALDHARPINDTELQAFLEGQLERLE
jgi:tetratricopeptide (TPR) repeat protein